jgi:hypothetical protein
MDFPHNRAKAHNGQLRRGEESTRGKSEKRVDFVRPFWLWKRKNRLSYLFHAPRCVVSCFLSGNLVATDTTAGLAEREVGGWSRRPAPPRCTLCLTIMRGGFTPPSTGRLPLCPLCPCAKNTAEDKFYHGGHGGRRGHTTRRGKPWNQAQVLRVLHRAEAAFDA